MQIIRRATQPDSRTTPTQLPGAAGQQRPRRGHLPAVVVAVIMAFLCLETPVWASGPANTAISNQASPSGFPAGSQIFDSATLGSGVDPTGTITFKLYGPGDPSCTGSPLVTSATVVQGNGYYQSNVFVTNAAGPYRWTARYNGDSDNNPTATTSCSHPTALVTVDKRRPTLSGNASLLSTTGTIRHTATLGSASGPTGPTGTLTFKLYGPDNLTCAGQPIFITSLPVSGVGAYQSSSFRPLMAGTYQWTVGYGGDANNWWAGTACFNPASAVAVLAVTGGAVVTASPTTVAPAGGLTATWSNISNPTSTDWVALHAVGSADGAITAWKYTNGSAAASVTMTVPWNAPPGTYEVRLFANNSYQRLATSQPVTVIPA